MKPKPRTKKTEKMLLTNEAEARASVWYLPTMMLSAKFTVMIPSCPRMIGVPMRSSSASELRRSLQRLPVGSMCKSLLSLMLMPTKVAIVY